MTLDVGCSTGLVALHQACRSIQAGESSLSIVGAACALLGPDMFIALSSQGYFSPTHMLEAAFTDFDLVYSVQMADATLGMIEPMVMVEERVWQRLF